MPKILVKPKKRLRGGVKVHHNKNTEDMAIRRLPEPEVVVLPMSQHIGAPCEPTVKKGDLVKVGQIIGDTDKFVSTPVHASVSGKVRDVKEQKLANGAVSNCVIIENDGKMELFEGIAPPIINNRDNLIKAMRDSGLVGLGGAGFPTHIKFRFDDEKVDTLLINAAECEPYITVDYRECIEKAYDIKESLLLIKKHFNFKNIFIAVEDNKPFAIKAMSEMAQDKAFENLVSVVPLRSLYPQGAEKMMIYAVTGRKVPPGKLPSDVGCVVANVSTMAFLSRYVKTGKPLVSRSLTIEGSAVGSPQNVRTAIGTSIQYIIDNCGGFKEHPVKIITGGPMMGISVVGTEHPIIKQNNAVLAFTKSDSVLKNETDCIKCGSCADVCPMRLMPELIHRYDVADDIKKLKKAGTMVCMECGCCSYVCPAGKPLVQYMRDAKAEIRRNS